MIKPILGLDDTIEGGRLVTMDAAGVGLNEYR